MGVVVVVVVVTVSCFEHTTVMQK